MEILGKKIDSGLVMAVVFAAAAVLFLLFNLFNFFVEKGNNSINGQSALLEKSNYELYNNKIVSGDTVIDCIRKAESVLPGKLTVSVTTKDSKNSDLVTKYGYVNGTYKDYAEVDKLSDDYINPYKSFLANVKKNNNGVFSEIDFVEQ